MSNGYNGVLVVVDKLSKYVHFIPLVHPYTAKSVARLFIEYVIKLHGLPRSIVTDRDQIFISKFWKEFFKMQGTQLAVSSAYHPQTDGQSEVTNRTLEQYLRCFVHQNSRRWEEFLPWAEYWYNMTYHASTKYSPFEIIYERRPPQLKSYPSEGSPNAEVDRELFERDILLRELKHTLEISINRMKEQHDKGRREEVFQARDWVYLKLQPHRQHSVSKKTLCKLGSRFYEPFQVIEKVGEVAYPLDLPQDDHIHPVIHVSQLKH